MAKRKFNKGGEVRLVAYYRYSGGSGQTEQSIEGQRRDCEAYARAHGMTILREYVDRHISGKPMTALPSSSWWPTVRRTPLTP